MLHTSLRYRPALPETQEYTKPTTKFQRHYYRQMFEQKKEKKPQSSLFREDD